MSPDFDQMLQSLKKLKIQKDAAYTERNQLVVAFAKLAMSFGWKVGVGQHPEDDCDWEKDWRSILFIDSPEGQLSWHFHDSEAKYLNAFPRYESVWDGHSTSEKYRRLGKLK